MGYTTERRSQLTLERQGELLKRLEKRGQHIIPNAKGFSNKYCNPCWCGGYHRIVAVSKLAADAFTLGELRSQEAGTASGTDQKDPSPSPASPSTPIS